MVYRVSEKEITEGKGCVLQSSGKVLGIAVGLVFIQLKCSASIPSAGPGRKCRVQIKTEKDM